VHSNNPNRLLHAGHIGIGLAEPNLLLRDHSTHLLAKAAKLNKLGTYHADVNCVRFASNLRGHYLVHSVHILLGLEKLDHRQSELVLAARAAHRYLSLRGKLQSEM
jgi:hypothetical protein